VVIACKSLPPSYAVDTDSTSPSSNLLNGGAGGGGTGGAGGGGTGGAGGGGGGGVGVISA